MPACGKVHVRKYIKRSVQTQKRPGREEEINLQEPSGPGRLWLCGVIAGGEPREKDKFLNAKAEAYWLVAKWMAHLGINNLQPLAPSSF